jgi:hypothetical protein
MNNSPSEPLFDITAGKFGPFSGQLFVGDVAGARLCRAWLEEVDGVMQGFCVHVVTHGLHAGNNRLVFSPDGTSLYTGQTVRGWGAPSEGLQRITFTGVVPFEVKTMSLTRDGFVLTFTKAVTASVAGDPASYHFNSSYYGNTHQYGSPQLDKTDLVVSKATVAADGLSVTLLVGGLKINRIIQLDVDPKLTSTDNEKIEHPMLCYKINRLRK